MTDPDEIRKQQLKERIYDILSLIADYEKKRDLATDAVEKGRCEDALAELYSRLNRYQAELKRLEAKPALKRLFEFLISERSGQLIVLVIAILACIAAWLVVPQIQQALFGPAPSPMPQAPAGEIFAATPTVTPPLPTNTPVPPTNTPLLPTATVTPIPPTSTPAQPSAGAVRVRTKDGAEMVYVLAGEFIMGSADRDSMARVDEKPQHTVYLDAFWIDKTEVTNAQYKKCVATGVCKESRYADDARFNGDTQPVVGVDWNDAKAYCTWAGGRLPTEAEWEKAARGNGGRIYPWGNEWDGSKLNFCDQNCEYEQKDASVNDGYRYTAPVGSYPAGASPYGALDMAGNVWELVADWYDGGYYARSPERNPTGPDSGQDKVVRGGSFLGIYPVDVHAAFRSLIGPSDRYYLIGFRCAQGSPQ